jgi:hypothetical protein
VPSSVAITSPASGSTVQANFTVTITYSNAEAVTAYVLLRCNHTGAHSHTVATVGPGGSGTANQSLTHTAGFTGASLEARLQLTQTWGDEYLVNTSVSNLAISDPDSGPGGGT